MQRPMSTRSNESAHREQLLFVGCVGLPGGDREAIGDSLISGRPSGRMVLTTECGMGFGDRAQGESNGCCWYDRVH